MYNDIIVSPKQIQDQCASYLILNSSKLSSEYPLLGISDPHNAKSQTLIFLNSKHPLHLIPKDTSIVAQNTLDAEYLSELGEHCQNLWTTPSVALAMSQILSLFDPRKSYQLTDFVLHSPGAWVHRTADLDTGVKLFPGVVIGAGARVDKDCEIRSQVTIEPLTEIGSNTLIHSGSTLGSDGYGFFKHPKTYEIYKIPQIGKVKIGSNVEIGSQVAIDRATLFETSIGANTKLDNLIHIAHNTRIGQSCFITAGFMCAGSVTIGDHFACGGGVAVADHIHICDHVTLGGRSVVTKDITQPGQYTGYPLEPIKDGLKTLSNLTLMTSLRKDIFQIKKHLGL